MSIRTVVTRGFGAGGSIAAVVLRGYIASATSPAGDTHDGGLTRREIERARAALKRTTDARDRSRAERRKAEAALAEAVRSAYEATVEGLQPADRAAIMAEAMGAPVIDAHVDWGRIAQNIETVTNLIAALEARARDEDDIEVLLLFM